MLKLILGTLIFFSVSFISNSQTTNPNSFLNIKLGTSLTNFKSSYPEISLDLFGYFQTNISISGMEVYSLNKTTSSGDEVKIYCCFYDDLLSVIAVQYSDFQSGKDLLIALKGKYGQFTSYNSFKWKDFMNGETRTTETFYWKKSTCILNFLYTYDIGIAQLVFADKFVQQKIKISKKQSATKKLE